MKRNIIAKSAAVLTIATLGIGLSSLPAFSQSESSGNVFDNISAGQTRNIQVDMIARVGPFELARGGFDVNLTNSSYSANTNYHTSGIAASVKQNSGTASSRGVVTNGSLRPRGYVNQETSGRRRRVTMTYNGGAPDVSVVPAYGSMGDPAATQAQKNNTLDPVTGLMELALVTGRDRNQPCGGTVRIFDGKRRYDISTQFVRMTTTSTPAYNGPVAYCTGTYTEIAGFKAKTNGESGTIPLELWLANVNNSGVSVPVRMRGRKGGVTATLYARKITIR